MCSNYRAETQALLTVTETVTQLETRPKKVVLLTRIRKFRRLHLTKFNKTFTSLTPRTTAVLQWIHAHTGIHGNEVADQLGKD